LLLLLLPSFLHHEQVYRGMLDAGRSIYKDHGMQGLYRGLGVTLIEIIPYAALQFGLYDAFNQTWQAAADSRRQRKQQQQQQQQQQQWHPDSQQDPHHDPQQQQHCQQPQHRGDSANPSSSSSSGSAVLDNKRLQTFACGLAAGLIAKLGSHPLDVAKKRYQVAGLPRSLRYGARVKEQLTLVPLMTCLADIYHREGVAGLWKGSVPSIVKAAPAAAITFTAYEAFITVLLGWQANASKQRQQAAAEKAL
jgi:solute carrier family 25 thiamine pyrophosphate transporter 19